MAKIHTVGLDELELDMEQIMVIPDSVKAAMVTDGAKVLADEQRKRVPVDTGDLRDSITVNKPKMTRDGAHADVTFEGIHHVSKKNGRQARNAEVAYVNEFGVPSGNKQPNPFIRLSNEAAADRAVEAEMDVYDAWLRQNNF